MTALHDAVLKAELPGASGYPRLFTLADKTRDLWYVGPNGTAQSATGNVTALCTGDGSTTSFTIGDMPVDVLVDKVEVVVYGALGTAATTLAVGYSGSTGAFMSASNFTASMDTAGVKTVTTVKAHLTTAKTVLATFSAAWDSGAKAIISVHYIKVPTVA